MKRYQALIIIFLITALLPFCYVCMYALPYADDFCIGWELLQGKPLLTSIAEQYLYWNGRYSSDVLINLHPVSTGSLGVYNAAILLSLTATPVVFYVLLQQVIKHSTSSIITSMVLTLLYLNYMPQLTEGIYWYGGIVNYHLGVLVAMLQLAVFVRLYITEKKSALQYAISVLLLVAAVGFNEVGAMLIPILYFTALLLNLKQQARNRKLIAIHFAVALIASAFVIFSPGNATRLGAFNGKYNFSHSTYYAALQTARFSGIWILNFPFIACSILVASYADKVRNSVIGGIDWRIASVATFVVVFTAAFLPYFATGILGQHRTMNYVYPFFLLLWLVAVAGLSNRYRLSELLLKTQGAKMGLLLSAIAVMCVTGNSLKIWLDIHDHKFATYKKEYLERQEEILIDAQNIQPLINVPRTFSITDAKPDSAHWVNRCMKIYYDKSQRALR